MNSETAWNMFVFRDGRRSVAGSTLVRDLSDSIRRLGAVSRHRNENSLMDALLRSGELECALEDTGSESACNLAKITDSLSDAFVGDSVVVPPKELLALIPEHHPAQLRISPPEGFAYYALHPLDYSDMALEVPLSSETACVIGIRSIGATLSSLVAATLRRRGMRTWRLTVRPTGHPYQRHTQFTECQLQAVVKLASQGADFLVVDEGPGMSGSSFLSVGDALLNTGVPRDKITFLCSRVPDPDSLRAPNAGERWRSFRALYAKKNSRLPRNANLYIGGGAWRKLLGLDNDEWPASWTQMERLKFISSDRRLLFKFEGFGRFGKAVNERARRIAKAGFGPLPIDFDQGFSVYRLIHGRPARKEDLSRSVISRVAEYCAFRSIEFRCEDGHDSEQLETMVRFNCTEEFGTDSVLASGALFAKHPVLADGRMMPHDHIVSTIGISKIDAATHGDDHFFPGPTDIAWDLAGAIVEWQMGDAASDQLISEYERLSGDRVQDRLPAFELAYAVFRMAYCKMAAAAMRGTDEEHRLTDAYQHYRAVASVQLGEASNSLAA